MVAPSKHQQQHQNHLKMLKARSGLSATFLMHIAIELPFAIQGLFASINLPFLDATNTTLVLIQLYAAMSLSTCLAAFFLFPLPESLPPKRHFALSLILYHTLAAGILLRAPRFIPTTFGSVMEAWRLTPENCWGLGHAFVGLAFAVWWQGTLQYAQAAKNASPSAITTTTATTQAPKKKQN